MAGEVQRVIQRKKELLDLSEQYGLRGSVTDDDAPTDEQYEREIVRAAARLTLARIEALLVKAL